MSRPAWELADVVRLFGEGLETSRPLPRHVLRTLGDILKCRTAVFGGHVDACDACGALRISYNSCRNRHCPKCQVVGREAWVVGREESLLPVPYYHVVFTLPDGLHGLCLYNPRSLYNALFDAAWETLQKFATDPKWLGAQTGATMVLHTWGQNLCLHPHVHCIVPGGGLAPGDCWVGAKNGGGGGRFLFPVKAMSKVFRAAFLHRVVPLAETGLLVLPPDEDAYRCPARWRAWRNALYQKPWVVYAKRPFGGPKQVIEYLGRYTHKAAISNHRLLEVGEKGVRFAYKDYRQAGAKKEMALDGVEFLRRFALHILPTGFRRMRHYGILANARKSAALAAARAALCPHDPPPPKRTRKERREEALRRLFKGADPTLCPCCKTGHLLRIGAIPPQRPPPPAQLPYWAPLNPMD
ncbi:MAG TPA: IS91 family transposase [Nitrospira sp.]|nr:IS91 family transposase [Nitrospira sp.]HNM20417.1 IS91 family transposase [Nitrospira sp.]HNP42056.1 IS91 family transposase [Nitrospira sp.]